MQGNSTADEYMTGATHEELRRGERPLTPDDDPFYEAPSGYEQAQPGAVLRSRAVELGFLGVIRQPVTATQLLYRTTNLHNEPEVAVTTVLVPAQRDPELGCPVLSYQCAIDAVASRCFPSYALRRGAGPIGAFVQSEFLLVAAALAEGWAVSVPDHEGCHGMWGSPYEPGYRILDGVRAALSCERLQTLAVGSGGIVGLFGRWTGLGVGRRADRKLCPRAQCRRRRVGLTCRRSRQRGAPPQSQRFRRTCGVDDRRADRRLPRRTERSSTSMPPQRAGHCFRSCERCPPPRPCGACATSTSAPMWTCPPTSCGTCRRFVTSSTKPSSGSRPPDPAVLIVQAVHDPIISVDDIDALVETYSRNGASIAYHRDRFCEHLLLHPLSAPMTLRWLRDRFNGRPLSEHGTVPSGRRCSTRPRISAC